MITISKIGRCVAVAGVVLTTFCSAALAQQVTVGWTASVDSSVKGYYVYYGTAPGVYTTKVDVGTNTAYTVSSLVVGSTYYFSATSYNAAKIESFPVTAISYTVPGYNIGLVQNPVNGSMNISFQAGLGQSYTLLTSPDLVNWTTLYVTNATSNGPMQFVDPINTNLAARFYQLLFN